MDELLLSPDSPSGQRKRPLSPKTPTSQRPRIAKKVKTGLTPHDITLYQGISGNSKTPKTRPVQKNAVAGPSTPAKPLSHNRKSSRISRPTAKKAATQTQRPAVVSDSDADLDSDQSFPSNILPKTPSNLKKRKLSTTSKPSPSSEHKARESKAKSNGKVVHLGAIELSSDSEDGPLVKPPKKRRKRNDRKSLSPTVISLCSGPEEALSPLKTPTQTRMEDDVVIILSSDDESHHSSAGLFTSGMDLDNQDIPIPHLPIKTLPELQGQKEPKVPTLAVSNQIPPTNSPHENVEIPIDCLQPSLNEALKDAKSKSNEEGDKVSCFTASTSARPVRMILFTRDIPNPILHTPGFFSRAIRDAKTAVLVAQKRAKRRKFEALLASSSTKHGTNEQTPVQCAKPCEPGVSTLAIAHSSSPSVLEDAVDRCVEGRTTSATYPAYTATETEESGALAASEAKGCESDQVPESKVTEVHASMEEQHIVGPISESTLTPFHNKASEGAFPSIDEEVQGRQDKLAQPVALNSIATASVSPALHPAGHSPISVDELNNEANLDGSEVSLGKSDSRQPEPHVPRELLNHVLTTSQLNSSRSISEIPEKTKSSAQCLIQILNDLQMSKKSINITPPNAVISPHIGGPNSLADCSPNSLSGSITSDPSEVESPLPITPSDSPAAESLIVPNTLTQLKTVDFDLNNFNLPLIMENSKCDYDDDDISLSGLEFMYPDDVC